MKAALVFLALPLLAPAVAEEVKDLAVKGAPKALKAGTKVRGIKLVEGDHNIDCRIDGFGAMALKSEFVKKA